LRDGLVSLYNIEVEELHAYFVGGGTQPVLVHNGLPAGPGGQGDCISKPKEVEAPKNGPTTYRDPKTGQLSFLEPDPPSIKGSNNPNTQGAALKGTQLHLNRPGSLPEQLRQRYPDTEFRFKNQGVAGQDVEFIGGKHPSEYPGSTWPRGIDYGDFKPDTPGGLKTFNSDQKNKWPDSTVMLPYDPNSGNLR
jgi:hypothetical protein